MLTHTLSLVFMYLVYTIIATLGKGVEQCA